MSLSSSEDSKKLSLKPCPFCGGKTIRDTFIRDGRRISCADCSSSVTAFQPNASERGATIWNGRHCESGWLPIAEADRAVTDIQEFPEAGLTLRMSDRYWVRDDDGRVYEAAWSEGNNGDRSYWWDFEGESPVDPVEFMPHPLDPKFQNVVGQRLVGQRLVLIPDAKFEAIRSALEKISSPTQTTDLLWWQIEARAALAVARPEER